MTDDEREEEIRKLMRLHHVERTYAERYVDRQLVHQMTRAIKDGDDVWSIVCDCDLMATPQKMKFSGSECECTIQLGGKSGPGTSSLSPGALRGQAPLKIRSRFVSVWDEPGYVPSVGKEFQVIVGNIGTVYHGTNRKEAERTFTEYQKLSHEAYGRGSKEDVTLLMDGKIIKERTYIGHAPLHSMVKRLRKLE